MNIERVTPVLKAADVFIGPTRVVGSASPILKQAETVASAAWNKLEVPQVFQSALVNVNLDPGVNPAVPDPAQQFFENNVRILSIMPVFNPQPEPKTSELNAANAISEAENILKQVAQPAVTKPAVEQVIFPLPKPEMDIFFRPEPKNRADPAVAAQVGIRPQTESRVFTRPAQVSYAPGEQSVESVPQPATLVGDIRENHTAVANSEESSLMKIRVVEDVVAANARKGEIRAAINRLRGTVGRIGKIVARLLTVRFWQAKSQLVGDRKDWTIELTAHSIASDETEYQTREEAERGLVDHVEKHLPVKKGEGRRRATVAEVRKVIYGQGREKLTPEAAIPAEIVIRRVVKKRSQVKNGIETTLMEEQSYAEPKIEDLGLAEVLNTSLTDQNHLS